MPAHLASAHSRDNRGLLATGAAFQLGERAGKLDEGTQNLLRLAGLTCRIGFIALDVYA
jgi:hypothetical protein